MGKYNINGTGKEGGGGPSPFMPGNRTTSGLGGSPGLITSTGGLFGISGAIYAPFIDTNVNRNYFIQLDPTNFDTEEAAYYYFPSPDSPNGVGRAVTINKFIIRYRQLGQATFFVGCIVYNATTDNFTFIEKKVVLGPTGKQGKYKTTFPDKKLHTIDVDFVITGENPQPYIRRVANSGPFSISKLIMIGVADEDEQL